MNIEQEIDLLKERNARVEADKAWETSGFRVVLIMAVTYVVAAVLLFAIGNEHAFRNALVPVVGFGLSTLSLPAVKRWWIAKRQRK